MKMQATPSPFLISPNLKPKITQIAEGLQRTDWTEDSLVRTANPNAVGFTPRQQQVQKSLLSFQFPSGARVEQLENGAGQRLAIQVVKPDGSPAFTGGQMHIDTRNREVKLSRELPVADQRVMLEQTVDRKGTSEMRLSFELPAQDFRGPDVRNYIITDHGKGPTAIRTDQVLANRQLEVETLEDGSGVLLHDRGDSLTIPWLLSPQIAGPKDKPGLFSRLLGRS